MHVLIKHFSLTQTHTHLSLSLSLSCFSDLIIRRLTCDDVCFLDSVSGIVSNSLAVLSIKSLPFLTGAGNLINDVSVSLLLTYTLTTSIIVGIQYLESRKALNNTGSPLLSTTNAAPDAAHYDRYGDHQEQPHSNGHGDDDTQRAVVGSSSIDANARPTPRRRP